MKLTTIRDLEAERDRLCAESIAGMAYVDTNPSASDALKALESISEIEMLIWHLEIVLHYWKPVAENEAVRSPLLDDADAGGGP